ncbi:OmpP1/FadL family transporter [Puniceicoccus vermicola]|uniref:Outer membrane protein transport protein n=1 Tax=Puniceicoccus vermicola TaxID=388746 RepID=A0A7X1E3S1_9BACT|nr:outer membrane protein transport protein [Puniceicoccus vermicola]MBC2601356.1 outer membrane protein transport protein [Puniceicoccus vermicola]
MFRPIQKPLLFLFPLLTSSLGAEGFRNAAPGAYALGQSGGRLAFIDDATAVTENPANLVDFEDREVLFAPAFVHISYEVDYDNGMTAKSGEPLKFLPNAYGVVPFADGKWAFGLGVSVPFGLAADWEQTGAFAPGGLLRYSAPYSSELLTVRINPTVAYRVNESLAVAGGLNFMYSRLRLEQYFPPVAFQGIPLVSSETVAEADMDGWGLGANLAVTWDVTEKDRLVATWRSEIPVDYSGDGTLGNLTPQAQSLGFTENGEAGTNITFPQIVGLGYGRKLTEALQAEIQFEWVGFSSFDELDLDFGQNTALFGGNNVIPEDWKDSYTLGISLRYDLQDGIRLHGSYQYFESPIPDSTLSTTIPDADQNAFTIGITKRWEMWYLGLGYSYVLYEDRTTVANGVSGEMESQLHLFSMSIGASF